MTDAASVTSALAGARAAVFAASAAKDALPADVDERAVGLVADAAKAAGLDRVVLVSSALVSPWNGWHPIRQEGGHNRPPPPPTPPSAPLTRGGRGAGCVGRMAAPPTTTAHPSLGPSHQGWQRGWVCWEDGGARRDSAPLSAHAHPLLLPTPKHPRSLLLNNMRKGKIMDAKYRGERLWIASGVPFTVVRPGGLTDGPAGQAALVVQQGDKAAGRVARADVAAVCVAALGDAAARNVVLELSSDAKRPAGDTPLEGLFAGLKPEEAA